jgi:hypothetical protein
MSRSFFDLVFQLLLFFLVFTIHGHLYLAFLRTDHHALCAHAAHHVKRALGLAAKRHLKHVFLDALLDGLFQFAVDLEIAVRRAQAADPLVRALVIVILDPETDPRTSVLETVELRPV